MSGATVHELPANEAQLGFELLCTFITLCTGSPGIAGGLSSLECARVLNALFFVATAAPLNLCGCQEAWRASLWPSKLVALLSLVSPINTYTAYFMPESMYFFVFWILTWFALS